MSPAPQARIGERERTALLAMSMAIVALGIDLLLPAFSNIRADLGLPADSTAVAGLITAYFVGLALGQPLWGPLSDQFGRKPLLYASIGLYMVGSLATAAAPTLPLLLAARFVWGLGSAGPRVLTIAIVRDRYEGEQMSRAMSLIMAIFLVVPIVAPAIGSVGVALASWRWLVLACTIAAAAMLAWSTRLAESLAPELRRPATISGLAGAARIVMSNRQTVLLTAAMTVLYGSFSSWLASSELIVADVFGQADAFPVIFGTVAAVMGAAMLVNARVVRQIGSWRLSRWAMGSYLVAVVTMVGFALVFDGIPPLLAFFVPLAVVMASQAILLPNINSLAMIPMASVAGMASSLIGAVQIAAGALLGTVIDRLFDGTIGPLSWSFLILGVTAAGLFGLAAADSDRTLAAPTTTTRNPLPPTETEQPAWASTS